MPDAVTLDPGNVDPTLGEPPQRRRAEPAQADHDHVFAENFHRRRRYSPTSVVPAGAKMWVLSPPSWPARLRRCPEGTGNHR